MKEDIKLKKKKKTSNIKSFIAGTSTNTQKKSIINQR